MGGGGGRVVAVEVEEKRGVEDRESEDRSVVGVDNRLTPIEREHLKQFIAMVTVLYWQGRAERESERDGELNATLKLKTSFFFPTLLPLLSASLSSTTPHQQTQMAPKRKLPPSRTTALPSSLRAELESLGHIPKKSASRKEKRKENRAKSGQANRDEHFANKKGKRQERDDDDDAGEGEEEEEEGGKKVRFEDEKEKEKPKQTPLEKLLAKQEGGGGGSSSSIYPKRKKSKVESVEDKEIAWLEAKLGAKSKGKWKDEMVDDGLDDLFDGLGDLEDAVFGNPDKVRFFLSPLLLPY